ncbi:hypothetical protein QM517_09470 [Rhodococcus sp. IEGM 1404]|nr:hypothetical protein [Microbacterium sp. IEGM 1404]
MRRGLSRGMVMIRYDGIEPSTAIAGPRDDQNGGWSALVSPDEVERVHALSRLRSSSNVRTWQKPTDPPVSG